MEIENVTITEAPVKAEQSPVTEESLKEAGLFPDEIEMAKKNGMIVKEEKKEEAKPVEKKAEVIPADELDSFEKLHDLYQTKPEAFYQLPKATRNLYHNSKGLYKKLKEAEEKRKEVESNFEYNKVQDSVSRVKLDRVKERLNNPEGITVEELQELIGIEQKLEDNKPLTRKDLEAIEATKEAEKASKAQKEQTEAQAKQERLNSKVLSTEAYAKENIKDITGGIYSNVDDVVKLASEMAGSKPRYSKQINDAFADDNLTESEIMEVIIDIARLNPSWGKKSDKSENNAGNVEKMVKNANKQQTSAILNSGKGSRVVTVDELTPEDASRLSQAEWNKLPRNVKDRILKQAA